ncbi:MAG: paraquat-inducible membrane protein A [Desulfuromonas sp.]|nr:MAG: paraquat-inducible membrane protein A [Desulfuromonas sp.]
MSCFATARKLGLVGCPDCHLLSRWPAVSGWQSAFCPRCGASLVQRKPRSLARTWALVLTAMVFYIPANLLPMMVTSSLGDKQMDTIMSGIISFLQDGSWGIALIIFTASIFVPFMKFAILIYLLLSVQIKSVWRPKDRTLLYRMTEAAGRWSMLDIYVVTIMVALVKLGILGDVEAGPAAVYFAAVVVITMIAAESFDPRLIWDAVEEAHE